MRRFVNLRGYTRGLYLDSFPLETILRSSDSLCESNQVDGSPWQELVSTSGHPVVEPHLTSALEGVFE